MEPLFTIITANYNSGPGLEKTIKSVQSQNVSYEHLIVDGVSTDQSLSFATEAAAADGRIKLVSERDAGVYDAMNKGIRLAKGRYIYFIGAGDPVHPGALEKIVPLLPADEWGFVYGDVVFQPEGKIYDGPFTVEKLFTLNVSQQAIFYGRDAFKLLGEFDLKYKRHSDWEFNYRCFGNRKIVKRYVPVTVADFEVGGISYTTDEDFLRDRSMLVRKHFGPLVFARYSVPRIPSRLRHYRIRMMQKLGLVK